MHTKVFLDGALIGQVAGIRPEVREDGAVEFRQQLGGQEILIEYFPKSSASEPKYSKFHFAPE